MPYSPLGRGFLTAKIQTLTIGGGRLAPEMPAFSGGNFERNLAIVQPPGSPGAPERREPGATGAGLGAGAGGRHHAHPRHQAPDVSGGKCGGAGNRTDAGRIWRSSTSRAAGRDAGHALSGVEHGGGKPLTREKDRHPMATEERVLCFERKLLEELGVFQGLSLDVGKYLPVVTSTPRLVYLNRSEAEQDKRYKQLIPYVLLICNDRILRYRRGKGGQETRLHGLYSVGVGGHISEEDHGLFSSDRGYQDGMRRELMEEVAVDAVKEAAVAVINDDSTEVGYVHFGVVHVMHLADENVAGRRSGIAGPGVYSHRRRAKGSLRLRILVPLLPGTSGGAAGGSEGQRLKAEGQPKIFEILPTNGHE